MLYIYVPRPLYCVADYEPLHHSRIHATYGEEAQDSLKAAASPWIPATVLLSVMIPGHKDTAFTSLSWTALWHLCLAAPCTVQWFNTCGVVSRLCPHLRCRPLLPSFHLRQAFSGKAFSLARCIKRQSQKREFLPSRWKCLETGSLLITSKALPWSGLASSDSTYEFTLLVAGAVCRCR